MQRPGGFATLVKNILGLPDPNAPVGGRNPKLMIREMAPKALENFHRIYKKKAPEVKLGVEAEDIARRLDSPDSMYNVPSLVRDWLRFEDITCVEACIIALRALEKGNLRIAHEVLELAVDDYLNSNPGDGQQVPEEIGSSAIGHLAALSRAWLLARALCESGQKMDGFEVFGPRGRGASFTSLSKSGRLQDLAPIRLVACECEDASVENWCRNASSQIKARELLRAVPLEEIAEEFEITGFSKEQLVHKFAFLLHITGIASETVLSKMPAFRQFSACVVGPLAEDIDREFLDQLLKSKLGMAISLFPRICGTEVDVGWWVSSADFLKQNGLAVETDRDTGALTDKGKELLARIVSEMMKIEIQPA